MRHEVVGRGECRPVVVEVEEIAPAAVRVGPDGIVEPLPGLGDRRRLLVGAERAVGGRGGAGPLALRLSRVDQDRPADRGGRQGGGSETAIDLDRLDLGEREIGEVHGPAEGAVERDAVEIDHHLLGARGAHRHRRELAAQALHLDPDRLAQELRDRCDPIGEIRRADHGREGGRIERRSLGHAAHLDPLHRTLGRLRLRRRLPRLVAGERRPARHKRAERQGGRQKKRAPGMRASRSPGHFAQSPEEGIRGSWADDSP